MFYLYAGTTPAQVGEVYEQFDLEIERLLEGKTPDAELARAKARLKTGKRMQHQTADSRTLETALNKLYGLPVNEFLNYDSEIEKVQIADIQKLLREKIVTTEPLRLTVQASS